MTVQWLKCCSQCHQAISIICMLGMLARMNHIGIYGFTLTPVKLANTISVMQEIATQWICSRFLIKELYLKNLAIIKKYEKSYILASPNEPAWWTYCTNWSSIKKYMSYEVPPDPYLNDSLYALLNLYVQQSLIIK